MSASRLVVCPQHGQVVALRLGPQAVICMACRTVLVTCGGCGGMTLAGTGDALRCELCGFERELRAEEREAIAAGPRVALPPAEQQPAAPPPKPVHAFEAPPMPRFRPGAQMPAPAKPRGYVAPKAKGAR